jgi:hypothetical protein
MPIPSSKPNKQAEHWEYGSFHKRYGPIYYKFVALLAKARFRFFVTAANPGLENGGFVMESKKKIYDLLPTGTYPKTILFSPGTIGKQALLQMQEAGLSFPVILKPDIGGRGMGVVLVKDAEGLNRYVRCYELPFLMQAFVDYPLEAGIFYVRMPNESTGKITGIVSKEFGKVTGDGSSTLEDLIRNNDRMYRQYDVLSKQFSDQLHQIPETGKEINLIPFGNHARGAAFYNASNRADRLLTEMVDKLSQQIPGFYYGRFDIRFTNWETLKKGLDFSIIELNGSGSEPTHIYDPSQTLSYARAEIVRHWKMQYEVANINMQSGVRAASLWEGLRMIRDNNSMDATLLALQQRVAEASVANPS